MTEENDYYRNGDEDEDSSSLKTLAIVATPAVIYLIIIVSSFQLPGQNAPILRYTALFLLILHLIIVMLVSLWYLFVDSLFTEKISEYTSDSVEFRRNIITRILTIFLPIVLVTVAFLSPLVQAIPFGQESGAAAAPRELWAPTVLMSVSIGLLGVYLWTAHMFIEADVEEIKGEIGYVKEFMDGKTEQIIRKKDWYGRFKAEIDNADGIIKITQNSPMAPQESNVTNWGGSFDLLKEKIKNENITVQWIISAASSDKMNYICDTIKELDKEGCQNVVIYGSFPLDKISQNDSQNDLFPEDLPIARTQSFQIFKGRHEISKGDVVMGINMGAGRREHLAEGPIYQGDFVTTDVVMMYEFNKYFDSYKNNCILLYAKGSKQEENIKKLKEYFEKYVSEDKHKSPPYQSDLEEFLDE